jgi:spore coat protein JB
MRFACKTKKGCMPMKQNDSFTGGAVFSTADALTEEMERLPPESSETLFPPREALRHGTLFPGLFIPTGEASSLPKSATLTHAIPFAAWEMRLYLNTHPCDRKALALYHGYCERCPGGYGYLACALYGTRKDSCPLCWNWVEGPWPWEIPPTAGKEA